MICRFAALKRKIQVSQVAEFFSTQSFHKRTEEHRGTKNNSPCISVLSVFFVVKRYNISVKFKV